MHSFKYHTAVSYLVITICISSVSLHLIFRCCKLCPCNSVIYVLMFDNLCRLYMEISHVVGILSLS